MCTTPSAPCNSDAKVEIVHFINLRMHAVGGPLPNPVTTQSRLVSFQAIYFTIFDVGEPLLSCSVTVLELALSLSFSVSRPGNSVDVCRATAL